MSEQDLRLKLRMERALWAAGFYTRTNVRLASIVRPNRGREPTAADLTDVDVLGVRFLEDLTPRKVAVDCKSGRQPSPIGRTFWLAGVMRHLVAERGYVVLTRGIPEHHREAGANLGVTLLQEADLDGFQARYPPIPEHLRVGSLAAHKYLEGNLDTVSKRLTTLVEFRDTMFWFYTPSRALTESIALTRGLIGEIDLKQKFHRALILDVASLFAVATLTVAGQLLRLASADIIETLRALFFGGLTGIARREQMIRRIRTIVQQVSHQGELPLDDAALFQLDPPYLTAIGEAVVRVMARPIEAAQAPRYLKVRLMHGLLFDEWDMLDLFGEMYSPLADKLATDLALAFLKSCGLNTEAAKMLGLAQ
jgi:hypothetical protein